MASTDPIANLAGSIVQLQGTQEFIANSIKENEQLASGAAFTNLWISQLHDDVIEREQEIDTQRRQLQDGGQVMKTLEQENEVLHDEVSDLSKKNAGYRQKMEEESTLRSDAISDARVREEQAHDFGKQLQESEQRSQDWQFLINQLLDVVAEAHCLANTASGITASSFGEFGDGLDSIRRSINMLGSLAEVTNRARKLQKSRREEKERAKTPGVQAVAATLPLIEKIRHLADSKLLKTSMTKAVMQTAHEDAMKSLKEDLVEHDEHYQRQPTDFQQAVSKERDAQAEGTLANSSTDFEPVAEDIGHHAEGHVSEDVDHRGSGEDMDLEVDRDQGEEALVSYEDASGLGHTATANEDQVMGGAGSDD